MGMFTSIIDPQSGTEYQIKCGWDECEIFKVGDRVPSKVYDNYPGEGYLLDDVYDGCAYPREDAWVIIKDSVVVAIEPRSEDEDDYNRLRKKYQIEKYPKHLWKEEAWQRKEEREAKYEKEYQEFLDSIAHLPPDERLGKILARPLMQMMHYRSIAREAFKIEEIK